MWFCLVDYPAHKISSISAGASLHTDRSALAEHVDSLDHIIDFNVDFKFGRNNPMQERLFLVMS